MHFLSLNHQPRCLFQISFIDQPHVGLLISSSKNLMSAFSRFGKHLLSLANLGYIHKERNLAVTSAIIVQLSQPQSGLRLISNCQPGYVATRVKMTYKFVIISTSLLTLKIVQEEYVLVSAAYPCLKSNNQLNLLALYL